MCTMTLLAFASFALLMAVDLLSISLMFDVFWKGLSDRMRQAAVSHRPNSNHAQAGGLQAGGARLIIPVQQSKAKQRRQHDIFQSQLEQGGNQ